MKTIYSILIALFIAVSFSSCATRVTPRSAQQVTVVKVAPKKHRVVTVRGKRYYYWNGRHYRRTNRGYVYVRL